MANKHVCIDEIRGCEGNCITINDYRVAGPKPWGGGIVVKNWVADVDDVIRALRDNDVVKVIHAQWLDGCAIHNGKEVYKSIDCSHCEEVFKIESEDREYWKKRFKVCPFCGAIMN